ncbi:MAG: DUF3866 family protein [Bacillota bacterium]
MIRIRTGEVMEIVEDNCDIQIVKVNIQDDSEGLAVVYPLLTGKVGVGEVVLLNTTAVNLQLGTGGVHFVISSVGDKNMDCSCGGHIMKMRYTPLQIKVTAAEEEVSPYHEEIKNFESLNQIPVLVGFLHSMLLPIVAGIKSIKENARIIYVMTDGGALPISFSKTVKRLKNMGWIAGTVTAGHAFGGDLEAVNIYSGLAAACSGYKPDLIIVAMGPGNVGTGTELGTTALETGQIINAVHSLEGLPILVPRLSFKDCRDRHYGISHHALTVLEKIALASSCVVFPILQDSGKKDKINEQIISRGLHSKHHIVFADGMGGIEYLYNNKIEVATMGRNINEDFEFFLTCCAAGSYAAKLI